MRVFLVLSALSLAAASPAATTTSPFCKTVVSLVSKLKASSTASAYCSSFLSISTKTVTVTSGIPSTSVATATSTTGTSTATVTVTGNQVTLTADYDTVTLTATTVTTPTITFTNTANGFGPDYKCYLTAAALQARAAPTKVVKPSCFDSISASSLLSSACSCLSIPTPTTTSTVRNTAGVTSTSVVNTIVTSTITITSIPVAIVTPVYTTTVTATSTAPAVTTTAIPSRFSIYSNSNGKSLYYTDNPLSFYTQAQAATLSNRIPYYLDDSCGLHIDFYGYNAYVDRGSRGLEDNTLVSAGNTPPVPLVYCRVDSATYELFCGFSADAVYRTSHTGGDRDGWLVDGQPKSTDFVLTAVPQV